MKKIKGLRVKVTYTVGLGDIEVPDSVFKALRKCYDAGGGIPMPDECVINRERELACAAEWMSDTIREGDAMDWEYEIESLDE